MDKRCGGIDGRTDERAKGATHKKSKLSEKKGRKSPQFFCSDEGKDGRSVRVIGTDERKDRRTGQGGRGSGGGDDGGRSGGMEGPNWRGFDETSKIKFEKCLMNPSKIQKTKFQKFKIQGRVVGSEATDVLEKIKIDNSENKFVSVKHRKIKIKI